MAERINKRLDIIATKHGAQNSSTTFHLPDPYNTSSDKIFGGGDKVDDNPNHWTWVAGTANNKTDMFNALIHFTTNPKTGEVWVVFASDRLSNNGDAYIDFEFLQSPMNRTESGFSTEGLNGGRTKGDFLLTVYFENNIAIVSGSTYVEGTNLFSKLQSLDWMFFGGILNSFANAGISCTGVGNNMCVRKSAYTSLGGYENIDFSITEDFKLFDELRKAGHGWKNILNAPTLNVSKPVETFSQLMKQRRRWITGAMELPWIWKIVFIVFGFFTPSLIAVLIFAPKIGLFLWFIKLFLEGIFLAMVAGRMQRIENLGSYLWFQLYSFIIPVFYMYYFLKREPNEWKGRVYA